MEEEPEELTDEAVESAWKSLEAKEKLPGSESQTSWSHSTCLNDKSLLSTCRGALG